jgi:hypothetical protein
MLNERRCTQHGEAVRGGTATDRKKQRGCYPARLEPLKTFAAE